jgi:hypothetical protein
MARVLVPLPDTDFDPDRNGGAPGGCCARPGTKWSSPPSRAGVPRCDPLLLTGVVMGKLGADPPAIADYRGDAG